MLIGVTPFYNRNRNMLLMKIKNSKVIFPDKTKYKIEYSDEIVDVIVSVSVHVNFVSYWPKIRPKDWDIKVTGQRSLPTRSFLALTLKSLKPKCLSLLLNPRCPLMCWMSSSLMQKTMSKTYRKPMCLKPAFAKSKSAKNNSKTLILDSELS